MTYVQVTPALWASVLAQPTESDRMRPAEPALMERFDASRGTIRRATGELVGEGFFPADRSREAYMLRRAQIRTLMPDELAAATDQDGRWHLNVKKFVPEFEGFAWVLERVKVPAEYDAAELIFIVPDCSLTGLIAAALTGGKAVLVTTCAMRCGFAILEPDRIADQHHSFASTLDELEHFGRLLTADELRGLSPSDFVVLGAFALTADGVDIDCGEAYFDLDLEWRLLSTIGLVTPVTSIVSVVISSQIVEVTLRVKEFDACVCLVTTVAGADTIRVPTWAPWPTGFFWTQRTDQHFDTTGDIRELCSENFVWNRKS